MVHKIQDIYTRYPFFGYRKIHAVLRRDGAKHNRKKIQRLMQTAKLKAIYPGKKTSIRNKEHKVFPVPTYLLVEAYGLRILFWAEALTSLVGMDELKVNSTMVCSIDLSKNKIKQIPENAFSLFGKVRKLNLCGNKLTHISAALKELGNLEQLDLEENEIAAVEASPLNKLKKLCKVLLRANNIDWVDSTVVSKLTRRNCYIELIDNCISEEHQKELIKLVSKGKQSKICLGRQRESVYDGGKNTKKARTN